MVADLPEPKIIPRDQHPISRDDIDREALKVLYRLRDAGYDAYLVGGGVRDLYMGKAPKDFDISTNARPGQLRKLFKNSRVIGKRFRLVQVFFHGGKIIEVSTLRCQSEFDIDGPDEVLAANNTYGTVAEDAFRRDLTINALFYEIENFTIIDYVNGVADLNSKSVRIIGDPERRIRRDPVRIMRAIRHAARNDFQIDAKTWGAIKRRADDLKLCPDSRLRDELLKDLKYGVSSRWAAMALDSGVFQVLFQCYEKRLSPEARELLLACLAVSDRLNQDKTQLPEPFLFALIMLPWAITEISLLNDVAASGKRGDLAKRVRAGIDDNFRRLNVKKSQKEAIVRLLASLPVFIRQAAKGKWPAWLKRKSYFADGLLFYNVYREATGGPVVPDEAKIIAEQPGSVKAGSRRSEPAKQGRAPAFARNTKGGVFGLRKS